MISLPVVQLQLTVGLISWWNFEKKFNLIFFSSVLLIKLHRQSNYFRETLIDLCNQRREISLIYQTQYIVELFFVTEFNHIHVLFLHCHLQVFANTSNCHVLALMMHILNIYVNVEATTKEFSTCIFIIKHFLGTCRWSSIYSRKYSFSKQEIARKTASLLHVFETLGSSYLHQVANKRQIAAAPD